jgi:flagellar basal body P-ring formation protein FlgA
MSNDKKMTMMGGRGERVIGYWRAIVLFSCLFAFFAPSTTFAEQFQTLASIRKIAADYARGEARQAMPAARLEVRSATLDSRLRLPLCQRPLMPSMPSGSSKVGHTVVSVRCIGAHSWKLYVPVDVKARLKVLIAAQPLERGAQVSGAMLSMAERNVARLPYGYFTHRNAVLGQVLRRNLSAGEVLTPGMLHPPLLVRRGQVVTLTAGAEGFSVSTQGVALQSGERGALVRVRNSRSKRVVQGVVTGSGQVSVQG